MPRVNNLDAQVQTPLPQLQSLLAALRPGEHVTVEQTKADFLKVKENLTRRRHEIPGADNHLEYIDACLIAEASGKLKFAG